MNFDTLQEQPKILLFNDVFTHQECDEVLHSGIEFEKSKGYSFTEGASILTNYRTSYSYHDINNKFKFITYRCFDLVKDYYWYMPFDTSNFEKIQFQRYDVGQEYLPHYDYFNHPGVTYIDNDRVATMITYLNDDFEGGSTYFVKLGIDVKPIKGSVLYFEYKYINELNSQTEHAGTPVTKGQKMIATSWVRRLSYSRG